MIRRPHVLLAAFAASAALHATLFCGFWFAAAQIHSQTPESPRASTALPQSSGVKAVIPVVFEIASSAGKKSAPCLGADCLLRSGDPGGKSEEASAGEKRRSGLAEVSRKKDDSSEENFPAAGTEHSPSVRKQRTGAGAEIQSNRKLDSNQDTAFPSQANGESPRRKKRRSKSPRLQESSGENLLSEKIDLAGEAPAFSSSLPTASPADAAADQLKTSVQVNQKDAPTAEDSSLNSSRSVDLSASALPENESEGKNGSSGTPRTAVEAAETKSDTNVHGEISDSTAGGGFGNGGKGSGTFGHSGVGNGGENGGKTVSPEIDSFAADIIRRLGKASAGCYPRQARRRGIEGVSSVRFCIGKNGAAEDFALVQSSGFPMLDGAARCVVDGAAPFDESGAGRCVQVPVRFRLKN